MPNLYQDTAESVAPAPALEGTAHADVAVVGGGFTGLSTALHLAEGGARVALLEAEQPGWGASGRNGGQVNPGLRHDPDVVERDFGSDLGGRMNALSGAAPSFVFALVERLGLECEGRRNGTLRAAIRASQVMPLRATVEQWQRRGAPVELLDAAAVAALTGTGRYAGALWDKRGGDVHPLRFARGLAQAAARAGAVVYGGTRARRITRVGTGWTVATDAGEVVADHVVLATNGYTDELWPGLRRSVVPVFGAVLATAPLSGDAARDIMPCRSVLYESGAITVYYRVDAAGRLVIGGRGPQREITAVAAVPHLVSYAERLWPQLRGCVWSHAWGGRLAMTRDHYPHLHELADGLWACLGYNGRGVAMATRLGAVLANRLLHPAAAVDMPVTHVKTIGLHALWPLAVRAAIARGRVAGFVGL